MTTAPKFTDKALDEALELKFECADLGREVTIRGYFVALLTELWNQGEGFSSKRPFGNSGWQGDLDAVLIKAGLVSGDLDEDGYVNNVDSAAANELIFAMIERMGA